MRARLWVLYHMFFYARIHLLSIFDVSSIFTMPTFSIQHDNILIGAGSRTIPPHWSAFHIRAPTLKDEVLTAHTPLLVTVPQRTVPCEDGSASSLFEDGNTV